MAAETNGYILFTINGVTHKVEEAELSGELLPPKTGLPDPEAAPITEDAIKAELAALWREAVNRSVQ